MIHKEMKHPKVGMQSTRKAVREKTESLNIKSNIYKNNHRELMGRRNLQQQKIVSFVIVEMDCQLGEI